jgi:hypothetical protein
VQAEEFMHIAKNNFNSFRSRMKDGMNTAAKNKALHNATLDAATRLIQEVHSSHPGMSRKHTIRKLECETTEGNTFEIRFQYGPYQCVYGTPNLPSSDVKEHSVTGLWLKNSNAVLHHTIHIPLIESQADSHETGLGYYDTLMSSIFGEELPSPSNTTWKTNWEAVSQEIRFVTETSS